MAVFVHIASEDDQVHWLADSQFEDSVQAMDEILDPGVQPSPWIQIAKVFDSQVKIGKMQQLQSGPPSVMG